MDTKNKEILKKWNVKIINDQAVKIIDQSGLTYTCHLERHGQVFAIPEGNQSNKKPYVIEGVVLRPLSGMITVRPSPHGNIADLKKEDAKVISELLSNMESMENGEISVERFTREYEGYVSY